ncbi:MAG: hypothetical protein J1F35_03470, partial [Erysipelotrichales bacterium]|nr:hypothetical protein [Erysipelotrichales bacterium]
MENDINLPINPIIENDDNNASEDFVLGAPVSKSKGNGTKKSTGTQNKSTQNKSTQNKSTQN